MAPQVGLEPTTVRLTAECSTTELLRNNISLRKHLLLILMNLSTRHLILIKNTLYSNDLLQIQNWSG